MNLRRQMLNTGSGRRGGRPPAHPRHGAAFQRVQPVGPGGEHPRGHGLHPLLDHFGGNLRFAWRPAPCSVTAAYRETHEYIKRIAERLSVSEDELELLTGDEEPVLAAQTEPVPEAAAAEDDISHADERVCASAPGSPIAAGRAHSGGAIGRCDGQSPAPSP